MSDPVTTFQGVEAELNYAEGTHRRRPAAIHDARPLKGQLSLDRQGFELHRQRTLVANFNHVAEVRAVYYPETEELLRRATGAARVLAFEHDVRSTEGRHGEDVRGPVHVVHDDYTEISAPERVRLYAPNEAETLLRGRYAIINAWRPIKGPVRAAPLAVCDARSLEVADLIPTSVVSNTKSICSDSASTIDGSIFRRWALMKSCCSNVSTRAGTAALALLPIPHSMIPRRRSTRPRARVSKCEHSHFLRKGGESSRQGRFSPKPSMAQGTCQQVA